MKITIEIPYEIAAAVWDNATWGGKLNQSIEIVVQNLIGSAANEYFRDFPETDREQLNSRFSAHRQDLQFRKK